mgnify:FL=1
MKCQKCGSKEANVKYTQIINGVKKEMNLCEDCARELGIGKELNFNMSMNLPSFLGGFFDEYNMDSFIPSIGSMREEGCNTCGTTYNEFANTGLFGCMECYDIFADRLDPILRNIQGSNRHIGRKSRSLDKSIVKNMEEKQKELNKNKENKKDSKESLEEKLKLAIKEERYEDAAKIRDEIKKFNKEN